MTRDPARLPQWLGHESRLASDVGMPETQSIKEKILQDWQGMLDLISSGTNTNENMTGQAYALMSSTIEELQVHDIWIKKIENEIRLLKAEAKIQSSGLKQRVTDSKGAQSPRVFGGSVKDGKDKEHFREWCAKVDQCVLCSSL